jgi:hypothetical protein
MKSTIKVLNSHPKFKFNPGSLGCTEQQPVVMVQGGRYQEQALVVVVR